MESSLCETSDIQKMVILTKQSMETGCKEFVCVCAIRTFHLCFPKWEVPGIQNAWRNKVSPKPVATWQQESGNVRAAFQPCFDAMLEGGIRCTGAGAEGGGVHAAVSGAGYARS